MIHSSPTRFHWFRLSFLATLLLAPLLPLHESGSGASLATIPRWSQSKFLAAFEQTVAPSNSGSFVPLAADSTEQNFSLMTEALLLGDIYAADLLRQSLHKEGVIYQLVRIEDGETPILGFMEAVPPGDEHYRGWGAVLVRSFPSCTRVYEAPHVQSDQYSEEIALLAFMEDPQACALVLSGARRDADSGDVPGEDAANSTENLFHSLTNWLARRGLAAGSPLWFVQIHGAGDRSGQPAIVGSNGTRGALPPGSPLPMIRDLVETGGHVQMGVCGKEPGQARTKRDAYHLCATGNAQGRLLSTLGVPETFLHFEIQRHIREEFHKGSSEGEAAVHDFLTAVQTALDDATR